MLEKLRIQNFKSWQDTGDIAFGSLTGFFGTNSSGKSSILQFLLMLKQTVESSDRSRVLHLGNEKSYVDLGTIHDIIHNQQVPSQLSFFIQWKDPEYDFEIGDETFTDVVTINSAPYSFSSAIAIQQDKLILKDLHYNHDLYSYHFEIIDNDSQPETNYKFSLINNQSGSTKETGAFRTPIKFYGIPNGVYLTYPAIEDKLQDVEESFYHLFEQIYYLGPLRDYPKRAYSWGGDNPQSVGSRGEDTVAALLTSRQQGPSIIISDDQPKRTVEEHVAYWLQELGLIHSFKVRSIAPNSRMYEVRIQRTAESASVFLTDVGFGVSQILPVLVLLFYVPEGSTVILEQPEIHLHPAVQAGLADVFIDAIKRRKLQIVLESHSEHLLQRLQRRMAEEVITPEAIKLYFTSIQQGRSELTTLDLDEYGNIRNWPEGFFGDTLGEAAAMMEAEMKRRMREQQA